MDVVSQLDIVVTEFQRVSANIAPDHLDNQTPCAAWKVRDVYRHLSAGRMYGSLIQGEEPSQEEVEQYYEQASDTDIPDDELATTTAAGLSGFVELFRSPDALERTIPVHLGDMTGETFARLSCLDILVHSWDLATATGQVVEVPDEVVDAIHEWAKGIFQPEWRHEFTFAPETPAPAGASAIERLAAFTGRTV